MNGVMSLHSSSCALSVRSGNRLEKVVDSSTSPYKTASGSGHFFGKRWKGWFSGYRQLLRSLPTTHRVIHTEYQGVEIAKRVDQSSDLPTHNSQVFTPCPMYPYTIPSRLGGWAPQYFVLFGLDGRGRKSAV